MCTRGATKITKKKEKGKNHIKNEKFKKNEKNVKKKLQKLKETPEKKMLLLK